jgi:hypothetical protein
MAFGYLVLVRSLGSENTLPKQMPCKFCCRRQSLKNYLREASSVAYSVLDFFPVVRLTLAVGASPGPHQI